MMAFVWGVWLLLALLVRSSCHGCTSGIPVPHIWVLPSEMLTQSNDEVFDEYTDGGDEEDDWDV